MLQKYENSLRTCYKNMYQEFRLLQFRKYVVASTERSEGRERARQVKGANEPRGGDGERAQRATANAACGGKLAAAPRREHGATRPPNGERATETPPSAAHHKKPNQKFLHCTSRALAFAPLERRFRTRAARLFVPEVCRLSRPLEPSA